jgi:hypothetical protein
VNNRVTTLRNHLKNTYPYSTVSKNFYIYSIKNSNLTNNHLKNTYSLPLKTNSVFDLLPENSLSIVLHNALLIFVAIVLRRSSSFVQTNSLSSGYNFSSSRVTGNFRRSGALARGKRLLTCFGTFSNFCKRPLQIIELLSTSTASSKVRFWAISREIDEIRNEATATIKNQAIPRSLASTKLLRHIYQQRVALR